MRNKQSKKDQNSNAGKYISYRKTEQQEEMPKSFIAAKTPNQKKYIRAIVENDIVICSGPAGTGKSLVPLGIALEHIFREDKPQNRLYITRPLVATSEKDFPWIKGTLMEKLEPYFAPILRNLEKLLGSKQKLEYLIDREIIVLQSIELMRGFTYENCFVVATEFQNTEVPQAVMALTRIGENCKMVIEGDIDQKDIKAYDGLRYMKTRIGHREDICASITMTQADIVRHPLVGKILDAIDYKGNQYQYDDDGIV